MKIDNRVFDLLWLAAVGLMLFLGDIRGPSIENDFIGVDKPPTSWAAIGVAPNAVYGRAPTSK